MDETTRTSGPQADDLVIATITRHADAVLRTARRHSICADDAQDAYQRALEILLRHAHRLDPERAGSWLHTVAKHEAMAIRRSRSRLVGSEEVDLDAVQADTTASPEEHVLQFEHLARSAEALKRLKPQEVRALWLKAAGNSYRDICDATGWTYTKVNRCLTEGRRSFLERYAGIEAGEECVRWQPVLSAMVDGEATGEQLVELRPHLRNCGACRATVRELHDAGPALGALLPPALLAAGGAHVEPATGFLTRLYETVSMTLHERAASAMLRAQAVVETATAHKAAAIAASAVAVAGAGAGAGGRVAVQDGDRLPTPPPSQARSAAQPAPSPTTATAARPTPQVRTPRPKLSPAKRDRTPEPPSRRPAATPAAPAPPAEPLIDPVESRAPRPASTATTATAPPLPTTQKTSRPASSATAEFGFETP